MHRIGLTGGIGTGKSTVSHYLETRYRLPILDADRYARDAVAPESPIFTAIVERYGRQVKHPDGSLDRRALGAIVFRDASERQWLEAQIHPFVRDRIADELQILSEKMAVLAIPLLFEANMTDLTDEIWVVWCTPEQQLARVTARDRLSAAQARERIASQMPLAAKMKRADRVLDNSGTQDALYAQIDRALPISL